jgi:hypothetical protein
VNTSQKIGTIAAVAATTLIVARALRPPTVYCELCDQVTDEPRRAALDVDADIFTEVCPDCLHAVRTAIYPVVREILDRKASLT